MRPPDDPTDELTELAGDQGEGEVGNELRDETQVDLEEDTSQPTPCTSPKPKDESQPSTEERSSASPCTGFSLRQRTRRPKTNIWSGSYTPL